MLGGLRSVVHSGFLRTVTLVPGGYGAEYGRGLGGLVRMASRAPPLEPYQGEIDADVLDASFAAGVGIDGGGGVFAAGRVGYLDSILGSTLSSGARRLFPLSRYRDFQGKLVFPLRDDEKLEVIVLTSSDASSISNNTASPSASARAGPGSILFPPWGQVRARLCGRRSRVVGPLCRLEPDPAPTSRRAWQRG
jgi:outer membrane receptor protein involved in Fe transport